MGVAIEHVELRPWTVYTVHSAIVSPSSVLSFGERKVELFNVFFQDLNSVVFCEGSR